MNAKYWLLGGLLALSLQGCQMPTQAQRQYQDEINRVTAGSKETDECNRTIAATPLGTEIFSQIFFEKDDSPNKMTLMISTEKLTEKQIQLLKEYVPKNVACRQARQKAVAGTYFQVPFSTLEAQYDDAYIKLIKGEITIGQANSIRDAALKQARGDLARANEQYRQVMNEMNNQEINQRRANAAVMLPYLMQQNAINAQNQQNQYNQQMQNIRNATPAYTPPVTTNCTTYGNQISCTSR